MSYPDINKPNFLDDILSRKELYSLAPNPEQKLRERGINDTLYGRHLQVHSHQLFTRNYMNPNTQYKRLHLLHVTGTGKTLCAVVMSQRFIEVYHEMYAATVMKIQNSRRHYFEIDKKTPTVFVLGFAGTKKAFVKELLSYPEFGYISRAELDELIKRQHAADDGSYADIKLYKDYYSQIKRRITNKSKDGFYKFYGYDEFVNRLFSSDKVKLTDIEAEITAQIKEGKDASLEATIHKYIEDGVIKVNHDLVQMFENSLMICDEVHNTYNMNMKNNRGVAIQYILDTVKSVRLLSMSATPINNSPTEVVELLNYLVPPELKVTKQMIFSGPRTFHPNKLEWIGELVKGKISFLQDLNPKYYPRRVFIGESIKISNSVENLSAGSEIPYLKFIPCEMSDNHQYAYNESRKELANQYAMPTDTHALYDMVFPDPDNPKSGIFKSGDIKMKIMSASSDWRAQTGIHVKKADNVDIFTGTFLARQNIAKYSTKYAKLLDIINNIIAGFGSEDGGQKIMIYHHRVKMSGVLLIQELLSANGFIDENSEPVSNTICCICGKTLGDHNSNLDIKLDHSFRPARFVIAHSNLDKNTMDISLLKFNSPENVHGTNYLILIASGIVKESYDFKDIQHLIIASLPINIPTLIQVFGRCVRKYSHINLPQEQRVVNIRILISTSQDKLVSAEEYRYIDKLSDYIVIQKIEREFNRNAIDASIHRDIIMPPEQRLEYLKGGEPIAMLGNLYFEPSTPLPPETSVSRTTFDAYKYNIEEIHNIAYIIKRLFIIQPVWTYDDLFAKVKAPPVLMEVNTQLFDENNFIIALHHMVTPTLNILTRVNNEYDIIDKLFDYNSKYIYIDGNQYSISHIGKYYILFPVSMAFNNPLNYIHTDQQQNMRDKEFLMIKELTRPQPQLSLDIETYTRKIRQSPGLSMNVKKFLENSNITQTYMNIREQAIKLFTKKQNNEYSLHINEFLFNYTMQFQINMIEEFIVYKMGIISKRDISSDLLELYDRLIDLYGSFGMLVKFGEVSKYKDVYKQYKSAITFDPDTPVGYMTSTGIRLFDSTDAAQNKDKININKQWFEINKLLLNRHITYKENDIIIGYMSLFDEGVNFKLRKPSDHIKEVLIRNRNSKISAAAIIKDFSRLTMTDTRLIERGEVCSTIKKPTLINIYSQLIGKKANIKDARIKLLCKLIRDILLEREIKERAKDTKYKYVYGWWDTMTPITI